ncbi:chemotaxis protein [Clostridium botulinum A2B7 92]|uniref:chemotaxis protein n=1 Tax=Clostridium botulinum TaxID=1491 RepID=UPI0007DEA9D6|nr:chemotaxis protein [Clostridium botulinum]KEI97149.1 chemotaxis protein [Clostridium botulinum A2B7 92]
MINILIFGTGSTSNFVTRLLNDNVEILAYVDNDNKKWRKHYYNKEIINPKYINEMKYDFIVIASQFNEEICNQLLDMGINKKRIFQFFKFVDLYWNMFKWQMDSYIKCEKKIEMLATGISYTSSGLKEELLNKKCFKFSIASQDLYYDYTIVKNIIENYKEKTKNLKYLIIGLSYYSFQYDMSLSAMKNKVILYYEILKDAHHFKKVENIYIEYEINENIASKIFKKDKDGWYDLNWNTKVLKIIEDKSHTGKLQAKIDCNKNYPKTVEENKEIFKNYLKLLKNNNIKPIVVVFPASKYYTKYFSKKIEDEFHSIINDFKKEYEFQYIDYFRSDLFEDDDFTDVSHLNPKGAEKFTQILNKEIQWQNGII